MLLVQNDKAHKSATKVRFVGVGCTYPSSASSVNPSPLATRLVAVRRSAPASSEA